MPLPRRCPPYAQELASRAAFPAQSRTRGRWGPTPTVPGPPQPPLSGLGWRAGRSKVLRHGSVCAAARFELQLLDEKLTSPAADKRKLRESVPGGAWWTSGPGFRRSGEVVNPLRRAHVTRRPRVAIERLRLARLTHRSGAKKCRRALPLWRSWRRPSTATRTVTRTAPPPCWSTGGAGSSTAKG